MRDGNTEHLCALVCLMLVLGVLPAAAAERDTELPSRWIADDGLPRPRHAPPRQDGPLVVQLEGQPPPAAVDSGGRVCLLVEDGVYEAIAERLATHVADLEAEGYSVLTERFVSGSAEELRSHLQGLHSEPGSLVGVELIGEVPYVLYEMMQDWDGPGGDPPEYEDFPCDLFFADLDGSFSDELDDGEVRAGNGKYDTWPGPRELEIWVSRLKTDRLYAFGDEVDLLNTYLDKTHAYRNGLLAAEPRALVYVDDDWTGRAASDTRQLEAIYGVAAVSTFSDTELTTRDDYELNRLPLDQELVWTRSHGSSFSHGYYRSGRQVFETVSAADYMALSPPALFYHLFVCSGCDYTGFGYLGGAVAFNPQAGLVAWGSTKTGGMRSEYEFYNSLEQGGSFGEAFVSWFNAVGNTSYAPRWYFGMVLIGDASLSIRNQPPKLRRQGTSDPCPLRGRPSDLEAILSAGPTRIDGGPLPVDFPGDRLAPPDSESCLIFYQWDGGHHLRAVRGDTPADVRLIGW